MVISTSMSSAGLDLLIVEVIYLLGFHGLIEQTSKRDLDMVTGGYRTRSIQSSFG